MDEAKTTSAVEAAEAHGHGNNIVLTYFFVWLGLAVLTAVEYVYAFAAKDLFVVLVGGLLLWAGIKAAMVAWYFMHLKFEGNWVYIILIPAAIFAVTLMLGLVPDIAMKPTDESLEDTGWSVPARAGDFVPPAAVSALAGRNV